MPLSEIIQLHRPDPVPFRFNYEYNIAFQPIFDLRHNRVWAYEALVRGPNGEPAANVLATIPNAAIYAADQQCRETAIGLAAELGMTEVLSLNFLRSALLGPVDYIAATLSCADGHRFPTDRILLEFSEAENILNITESRAVVNRHASRGFMTAMDDFGAGYQGLSLLCEVRPDVIKLDMSLIRGVELDPRRSVIVGSILTLCRDLGIHAVVEGVETRGELVRLHALGVDYVQGFLLGRPKVGTLLTQKQAADACLIGLETQRTAV